jgi:myo-inositol-1(or 4)-monophosphatase
MFVKELAVAIEAARAAGAALRRWFDGGYTVRHKDRGHDDPVTDADTEANSIIRAHIDRAFPQDGWLSEETRDSPARLAKSRVWIVDPMDGTREFVRRIPEFAVSIALADAGDPVLGVVYNPIHDELIAGTRGQGITLNGVPARVTDQDELNRALVLASSSEFDAGEWNEFRGELQFTVVGSVAYKLGLLAAGQCDATFSLRPKNEWDVCAGHALVYEAGGRMTDRFGAPLRFNRPEPAFPGTLASNGLLHAQILTLLRRHGKLPD